MCYTIITNQKANNSAMGRSGGSTHRILLHRMESKAFRIIKTSPPTDCFQPLSHHRNVASLAIFYRYFHADCSIDLAICMLPFLLQPRRTRLSSSSHPYLIQLSNARVTSTLNHSFLSLVNAGTLCLPLYFQPPMI